MDKHNLQREVSGSELVDILGRASSEMGFGFKNMEVFLYGALKRHGIEPETKEPKTSATYRAEKSYPEKGTIAFDTIPSLGVTFPDIDENARYDSVQCKTELGTMRFEEVDINQYAEFKPDYDALIEKVIELSK